MNLDPGNRLYYYCTLSTALKYILPNKQLLLNKITKTNDPRENKDFVFTILNYPNYLPKTYAKKISDLLRKNCKLLCFSNDHKPYWGYQSSRMWSHYGGNHKGVCLMLNKKKFIEENKDKIDLKVFRKIKYHHFNPDNPQNLKVIDYALIQSKGLKNYLKEFRIQQMKYLFFTKSKDWESEKEIRLIYFSTKHGKEYCTISKSLSNIYLGVCCKEISKIKSLCPTTDIYEMQFFEHGLYPV